MSQLQTQKHTMTHCTQIWFPFKSASKRKTYHVPLAISKLVDDFGRKSACEGSCYSCEVSIVPHNAEKIDSCKTNIYSCPTNIGSCQTRTEFLDIPCESTTRQLLVDQIRDHLHSRTSILHVHIYNVVLEIRELQIKVGDSNKMTPLRLPPLPAITP